MRPEIRRPEEVPEDAGGLEGECETHVRAQREVVAYQDSSPARAQIIEPIDCSVIVRRHHRSSLEVNTPYTCLCPVSVQSQLRTSLRVLPQDVLFLANRPGHAWDNPYNYPSLC
jgi:hypothetical protein